MSFVTFIIPTLGRYSIHKSLDSLRNQTDQDWDAIVVFDRHDVTIPVTDKIKAFRYDKPRGGAGIVRNAALPLVTSQWTAFLDDDDFLSSNYVEDLRQYSDYDMVHYTYRDVENGNTQPPHNLNHYVACNFGISFAVKTDFIRKNDIKFVETGVEDFYFIDSCVKAGARYIITHKILYFVGHRSAWQ